MLIENQRNQKDVVVVKKRVKNDAKLVVNLKRERKEREKPSEEKEDVNFTDATTWALSLFPQIRQFHEGVLLLDVFF